MLAHAATFQGLHVVNHILGLTDNIRPDIMPSAIFTNPEAASVGLSEDRCKELGLEYTCKKGFFRANGKALAMNETDGMVKLISDSDDKIIGCHIFGAHASDMVQEIAALMNAGATTRQLADIIHIHPTLRRHSATCASANPTTQSVRQQSSRPQTDGYACRRTLSFSIHYL